MTLTDGQLVERVRSGDRDAFGDLVGRYRDMVYGRSRNEVTLRERLSSGISYGFPCIRVRSLMQGNLSEGRQTLSWGVS